VLQEIQEDKAQLVVMVVLVVTMEVLEHRGVYQEEQQEMQ
jgi:hypothetical protein